MLPLIPVVIAGAKLAGKGYVAYKTYKGVRKLVRVVK